MSISELDFEQIYTTFQPKIRGYLARLVGAEEAEDLTQEVFIKINKALHTFKQDSKLSTWIYQIATNAGIDRMRCRSFKQAGAELQHLTESDLHGKNARSSKRAQSIEEQIIREEMSECIQDFVATLPDNYRTVIILSEMEGLKNSDIAAILGLSVSTVKIRLHRAREKLKELLVANCNFYRTDCCGRLACEPKGTMPPKNKPLPQDTKN